MAKTEMTFILAMIPVPGYRSVVVLSPRWTLKLFYLPSIVLDGLVSEWLACWTPAQKAWVQIAAATLLGNSLRQTAHTHRASVHQAAKLVAVLLRVAGVTAGLAESNGSLPPGL